MIELIDALKRYKANSFTDDDVTRHTGLSGRAWRELLKIGAVRKVSDQRGPGRKRTVDSDMFMQAAIIAALHRSGFSLAIAGRLAHFMPMDWLIYIACDPWVVLVDQIEWPETGLPRFRNPPVNNWFDRETPAKADPDDWRIEVYDGRYVGMLLPSRRRSKTIIYGDLRREGTQFVSWYPFHLEKGYVSTADEIARYPYRPDPKFLDYTFEDHPKKDDPLRALADDAAKSPVFMTSVNITLAIRKALRRYLGIDPAIEQNPEA